MNSFSDLFQAATGHRPYPYQGKLAEAEALPQVMSIPTGAGKTAAVIVAWLWRRRYANEAVRRMTPRRLVYCLPMRVLVEQTLDVAERILKALGLTDGIGLHLLLGGDVSRDWTMHPEQDAILIGTQDMLLSRALNRGYAAGRSRWPMEFGLLNNDALWVLDEPQLMTTGLATSIQLDAFRQAMGVYGTCPSIWMSATLSRAWLNTVDHPKLSDTVDGLGLDQADRATPALGKRLNAKKVLKGLGQDIAGDPEELPATILKAHEDALSADKAPGITLVVVNTVKRARAIHEAVATIARPPTGKKRHARASGRLPILLLHSRFRPQDRRQQVRKLLVAQETILGVRNAGAQNEIASDLASFCALVSERGLIVVSTQVVEAGVDLSARVLFTDLAPWASLVQRFGRCNRAGEFSLATVFWMDLDEEKGAAPYDPSSLKDARSILKERDGRSVAPEALPQVDLPFEHAAVVRRKDVIELFDTTPDLAGNDIDISRFIRETDDLDVLILWRGLASGPEAADSTPPQRDELCPVPVMEFREFVATLSRTPQGDIAPHRWDFLEGRWVPCRPSDIYAGQVYLLEPAAGGYAPEEGWTGRVRGGLVAPLPTLPAGSADHHGADLLTKSSDWITVASHTDTVVAALREILAELPGVSQTALVQGARWHDRGKPHDIFQQALPCDEAHPPGVWAKAPDLRPYKKPHFRHEVASALAVLQAPSDLIPRNLRDLVAYLVAAHHGKVRLSIRSFPGETRPDDDRPFARGVWEGDPLPETDLGGGSIAPAVCLDLAPVQLGDTAPDAPSWAARMLALRDSPQLGPFRLGFLEALLRAADQRASAGNHGDRHA